MTTLYFSYNQVNYILLTRSCKKCLKGVILAVLTKHEIFKTCSKLIKKSKNELPNRVIRHLRLVAVIKINWSINYWRLNLCIFLLFEFWLHNWSKYQKIIQTQANLSILKNWLFKLLNNRKIDLSLSPSLITIVIIEKRNRSNRPCL